MASSKKGKKKGSEEKGTYRPINLRRKSDRQLWETLRYAIPRYEAELGRRIDEKNIVNIFVPRSGVEQQSVQYIAEKGKETWSGVMTSLQMEVYASRDPDDRYRIEQKSAEQARPPASEGGERSRPSQRNNNAAVKEKTRAPPEASTAVPPPAQPASLEERCQTSSETRREGASGGGSVMAVFGYAAVTRAGRKIGTAVKQSSQSALSVLGREARHLGELFLENPSPSEWLGNIRAYVSGRENYNLVVKSLTPRKKP